MSSGYRAFQRNCVVILSLSLPHGQTGNRLFWNILIILLQTPMLNLLTAKFVLLTG